MNQKLPEGWDEEKIQRIIEAYEEDAERGQLLAQPHKKRNDYALVEIPKALLPEVRKLVARYEESESK
jgi:hypothetical protein